MYPCEFNLAGIRGALAPSLLLERQRLPSCGELDRGAPSELIHHKRQQRCELVIRQVGII